MYDELSDLPSTVLRKVKRETNARPEKGFPQMGRHHYLAWLNNFHKAENPSVYFEIGTESGASLAFARDIAIAVDPVFKLGDNVVRQQSQVHLFQQTSDDFFETGFLNAFEKEIDFAFLDGMHQVEYLLRDFMNIERHMALDGVIAMHDCVPMSYAAAERDWDKTKTRRWTGDVWKIIPILRTYRPDLDIRVLDLPPSGIVEIRNLQPGNTDLQTAYDEIVEKYVPMTLEEFGLEELKNTLELVQVEEITSFQDEPVVWEIPENPAAHSLKIAIKTPKARRTNPKKIVDHAFARSIADGFLQAGHSVRIDSGYDWYRDTQGTDFDLVLRGRGGYEPQPNIPHVVWAIYPGAKERHEITQEEVSAAAHCFFASELAYEEFSNKGNSNISVLLQGFDPRIMHLPEQDHRADTVFVGSNHFSNTDMRPIIQMSLDAQHNTKIWGRGWTAPEVEPMLQAKYIDNSNVGNLYRGAKIVLCDHMEPMRVGGYISNRIFDALACGSAVISDHIAGLPDEFKQDVFLCQTSEDFSNAVQTIEAETEAEAAERKERVRSLLQKHSLFVRAKEISEKLLELKTQRA